jgi:hypothetical protein
VVSILAKVELKYNVGIIEKTLVYSFTFVIVNTIDISNIFIVGYILFMTFSSNTPKITPKTIAYLRVSTIDQDIDKNKAAILALANSKVLGHVRLCVQRRLACSVGGKPTRGKARAL